MKLPLQLEPTPLLIENEHGVKERAAWVHVSIEQVAAVFPKIKYGKYCETPKCAHQLHAAIILHAVFYSQPKRVDVWVSCWDCYQIMLANGSSA